MLPCSLYAEFSLDRNETQAYQISDICSGSDVWLDQACNEAMFEDVQNVV